MKRLLIVAPVLATGVIGLALFLQFNASRAVQAPSMALDMNPADNTYDPTTNAMTVVFDPAADFCLGAATADPADHFHDVDLIINNVEDLVGWQARFNYIGDQMRVAFHNPTPFTDTAAIGGAQQIGFNNLPKDVSPPRHRALIAAETIPPSSPGTQTALIGATYNGTQGFDISPDTPAKSPPDPGGSYNAPNGGVLDRVTLEVLPNQTGVLNMDLSDDVPNPPGSNVVVFTGTGTTSIALSETSLGDAQHVEGGVCGQATPPPTPSPTETPGPSSAAPTPTRAPGSTGATTPASTSSAGASGAASRTPTPRVSPAALPPTGNADEGGPSPMGYVLLLAAVALLVTAAGHRIWRLRRR